MPLHPVAVNKPFEKWGLDFIGPISPATRGSQARYIITAIDYVTKWAEARAVRKADALTTAKFLYEDIITRFGCPLEIISAQGTHFINETIEIRTEKFMISHRKSTPYYPRANGQAESTNKILVAILTKIVGVKRTDWGTKLSAALWAYRTSYKVATGCTPFKLVYGLEAVMLWEFLIPSLRIAEAEKWDGHELHDRMHNLEKLEEERLIALQGMIVEKQRRKQWYDRQLKDKNIHEGDMVLLFGVRNKKQKLKYTGMGPYQICEITPQGTVRVEILDGIETVGFLNGSKFKRYYDPLTIETIQVERDKQANKEKELKRIKNAIQEGKDREAKNKLRKQKTNVWTYDVLMCDIDQTQPDLVRTQIQLQGTKEKVLYNALLDTGASHNLVSFEAWNKLGRPPLDQTPIKVKGINGLTSYILGILTTQIYVYNGHMEASFLVLPTGVLSETIILG